MMTLGLSPVLGAAPGASAPPVVNPNLLLWTEEFDNAVWIATGCTVTADAGADPNGTVTAESVANGPSGTLRQVSTTPATSGSAVTLLVQVAVADTWERFSVTGTFDSLPHTFSLYFKNDGTTVRLRLDRSGGFLRCGIEDVGDEAFYYVWGAKLEQAASASAYQHRTT